MTAKTSYDQLYTNAKICTMADGKYNIIEHGMIGISDERVAFIGTSAQLPPNAQHTQIYDLKGKLVTPAFIDCHTHLIYGGNRAAEFEQRLTGVSYEDIARQGGGIMSTVNATRTSSEDELYESALKRLNILRREGIVAFEIKSGYGLDLETERKMLRVATRLRDKTSLTIKRTFLGAHALPPEYKNRADEYINYVCNTIMPALHEDNLIDAVDVFCENIAFNIEQTKHVFEAAKKLNLPVKIHAEQLSNMGGTKCAAEYNALSADHIEYLDAEGVGAMSQTNMIATILPGAFYTLHETQKPPIDLLRQHNVPMALATDHNPGSSPTLSLLLMMNMGCTCFQMTPEETLAGTTINAAKALDIHHDYGSLENGKKAHFIIWDDLIEPAELSYRFGYTPSHTLIKLNL
jgi:imidazolonepropionase